MTFLEALYVVWKRFGSNDIVRIILLSFSITSLFFLGYFSRIGFQYIPLVDKQHLIGTLLLYISCISAFLIIIRSYVHVLLNTNQFYFNHKDSKSLRTIKRYFIYSARIACLVLFVLFLILRAPYWLNVWSVFLLVLVIMIAWTGYSCINSQDERDVTIGVTFIYVGIVLSVFTGGHAWAHAQLRTSSPTKITTPNGAHVVKIVLVSSNGILAYKEENKSTSFFPWANITEVNYNKEHSLAEGNYITLLIEKADELIMLGACNIDAFIRIQMTHQPSILCWNLYRHSK